MWLSAPIPSGPLYPYLTLRAAVFKGSRGKALYSFANSGNVGNSFASMYIPGRKIGVRLVVRVVHHELYARCDPPQVPPEGRQRSIFFTLYSMRQYTQNVRPTRSVYPLVYVVPAALVCYALQKRGQNVNKHQTYCEQM